MAERFDSFPVKRKVANSERLAELRRFFPTVRTVSIADRYMITGNELHRNVSVFAVPFVAKVKGEYCGYTCKNEVFSQLEASECVYCSPGMSFGYLDRDIVRRNDYLVPEFVYPYRIAPENFEEALQKDLLSLRSKLIIDTRLLDLTRMVKQSVSDFLLEMQAATPETLPYIMLLYEDAVQKAKSKNEYTEFALNMRKIFKRHAQIKIIELDPHQRILKYLLDDLDVFYKDQVIALIWDSKNEAITDYSLNFNGVLLRKVLRDGEYFVSCVGF